jgi:hypothetical protein
MPDSIFYSWQSDCPANTNHNFISTALEKAVEELMKAESTLLLTETPLVYLDHPILVSLYLQKLMSPLYFFATSQSLTAVEADPRRTLINVYEILRSPLILKRC